MIVSNYIATRCGLLYIACRWGRTLFVVFTGIQLGRERKYNKNKYLVMNYVASRNQ